MIILVIATILLFPSCSGVPNTASLQRMACRLLPDHCQSFQFILSKSNTDIVQLDTTGQFPSNVTVIIKGSHNSALVTGFSFYLDNYCNATFSQFGLSTSAKLELPLLEGTVTVKLNNLTKYYGNVCVYSYSYWFWSWKQWESHLDWIIYQGFNLVYVPTGIEFVHLELLQTLNLTDYEIYSFFNGPAYLAWSRMGNMYNFTAPVTYEFLTSQVALHRNISNRLQEVGAKVVIPGFSGFVPNSLVNYFDPDDFNDVSCWNNFTSDYSCIKQLDPSKPLYEKIGNMYMKILLQTFESNCFYAVDMFNENTPKNSSHAYLDDSGKSTVNVIKSGDEKGTWILQGWTFGFDKFWTEDKVEAYLKSVSPDEVLVLDMFAEINPTWNRTKSFFGKPFIWTTVNNFGGNTVISGNILQMLGEFSRTLNVTAWCKGFGFMPEGIYENTIMVDALMKYSVFGIQSFNNVPLFYEHWIDNVQSYRYNNRGSNLLKKVIETYYSKLNGYYFPKNSIIYRRPSFSFDYIQLADRGTSNNILKSYLNQMEYQLAVDYNPTFLYDLSTVITALVDQYFYEEFTHLISSYNKKDHPQFKKHSKNMLSILMMLDESLRYIPLRSLPCYEKEVVKFAGFVGDNPEKLNQDFRLQITTWGYDEEILDYAFKIWHEVIRVYYVARWYVFVEFLEESLVGGTDFDYEGFERNVTIVEKSFIVKGGHQECIPWSQDSVFFLGKIVIDILTLTKVF